VSKEKPLFVDFAQKQTYKLAKSVEIAQKFPEEAGIIIAARNRKDVMTQLRYFAGAPL
jgi:hypothetical protein